MNKGNRVFSIICLGLSCWLILESLKYKYIVKYTPGPGFFPFWLGIVLLGFSIVLLVETFRGKGDKNSDAPRLPPRHSLYRVGLITLFTAGLALLMTPLGFVPGVILFVTVILCLLEKVAIVKGVVTGLIMSICIYLIFEYWMEIGLPPGLMGFLSR